MPRKKTPKSTTSMNFIAGEPLDTDIYMGKGHGVGSRQGNQEYHEYILASIPRYLQLGTQARSELFKEMVATIKRNNARFIAFDKKSGKHFEVCDNVARAKVGQVRFV